MQGVGITSSYIILIFSQYTIRSIVHIQHGILIQHSVFLYIDGLILELFVTGWFLSVFQYYSTGFKKTLTHRKPRL